jgi:hypothetical protein
MGPRFPGTIRPQRVVTGIVDTQSTSPLTLRTLPGPLTDPKEPYGQLPSKCIADPEGLRSCANQSVPSLRLNIERNASNAACPAAYHQLAGTIRSEKVGESSQVSILLNSWNPRTNLEIKGPPVTAALST